MDGDPLDPLEGIPWCRSVFDQEDFFQDGMGRQWPIDQMPATMAQAHLDQLRENSISCMVTYTEQQTESVNAARAHGYTVPNGWEPSSARAYDEFTWLTIEGDPQRRRGALATAWLESRPLVQALQRRAQTRP